MKKLLLITAIFEALTGLALIIAPALVASLLLGEEPLGSVALTITRIAGAALISLAIACWLASNDVKSKAAKGIVTAILVYNISATGFLVFAALSFHLSGIGLWPVVFIHVAMAIWCIKCMAMKTFK